MAWTTAAAIYFVIWWVVLFTVLPFGVRNAAEAGETIGKGDDHRGHALFPDQPVEPLRQVLAEACPVRVREAASGEADEIDEQWQSFSVMPGRDVDIDGAHRGIAQHIALQRPALDRDAADRTHRPEEFAHASSH